MEARQPRMSKIQIVHLCHYTAPKLALLETKPNASSFISVNIFGSFCFLTMLSNLLLISPLKTTLTGPCKVPGTI